MTTLEGEAPSATSSRGAGVRAGLLEAGPLAAAGLAANAANVVVTVVLARLLAAHGYGALTQLTGVFLVVSTPGSAVIVAVVRHVTACAGDRPRARAWASLAHRRALLALALFALAVLAVGPVLSNALGRGGATGFDAVAVAGGAWVLLCLDRGLLQARRAYRPLAANLLAEGGLRTACMLVFVAIGWGVSGAAVGILVAEILTALHARVAAERLLGWRLRAAAPAPEADAGPAAAARATSLSTRRLARGWRGAGVARRDTVAALCALGAVAVLQNADVIVIGRTGPSVAGAYAAVSVSSKFIVFAALVVGWYMLPEAAIRWRDGEHALRQLSVTLLLLAVPAAVLLGVAGLAPRAFLTTFFSARYVLAAGAFLPLAGAMVCLSVSVVLSMYLLAVGDRRIVALLAGGAALATGGFAAAHGNPVATAQIDLAVQGCVAACAAGQLALVHRHRARARGLPAVVLPFADAAFGRRYARRR